MTNLCLSVSIPTNLQPQRLENALNAVSDLQMQLRPVEVTKELLIRFDDIFTERPHKGHSRHNVTKAKGHSSHAVTKSSTIPTRFRQPTIRDALITENFPMAGRIPWPHYYVDATISISSDPRTTLFSTGKRPNV